LLDHRRARGVDEAPVKRFGPIALGLAGLLALVVMLFIGWPRIDKDNPRSVRHGEPVAQQRMKDALREAGIPFSVEVRDGQEFLTWPPAHNEAALAVIDRFGGKPLTDGRNAHFPDPAVQKQFTDWLAQRGIKHEVVTTHGDAFVVWDPAAGDLVGQFMESRRADCKERC
jgi:hypothetical protein